MHAASQPCILSHQISNKQKSSPFKADLQNIQVHFFLKKEKKTEKSFALSAYRII